MKTTHIVSLFAAATLSAVLTAPAAAAPASKRMGPSTVNQRSVRSTPQVEHKALKRVGPIGKGTVRNTVR